MLHDVGKLAVPDYVLNKPGALSHAEFETIKLHAAKGAEILTRRRITVSGRADREKSSRAVERERLPDGLSGEDIPFGARILTVVDCFDAVTSDRPYRRRMTDTEAVEILRSRSGSMYRPPGCHGIHRSGAGPAARRSTGRRARGRRGTRAGDRRCPGEPLNANPIAAGAMGRPSLLAVIGPMLTERLALMRPAAEACLFAPEAGFDFLIVAYATALVRDEVSALRLRVGEGLAGWVAANRHTIVNSTPDLDIGDTAVELGLPVVHGRAGVCAGQSRGGAVRLLAGAARVQRRRRARDRGARPGHRDGSRQGRIAVLRRTAGAIL